jgi:CheY-like chemotaxis protein
MPEKGPVDRSMDDELFLVLIVDDEVTIAETLAELVRDLGYSPLVAQNGQQELQLLQDYWPALVITDLMMPLMDGATLVNKLHAEAQRRQRKPPRMIMLTAAGTRSLANIDVDALMLKPFDLDELEQLIFRLLK